MKRGVRGYGMVLAGVIGLGVGVSGYGATYYVSTTGSDTSGLGTLASPFASLTRAQSAASSGDTVYVRGGTYTPTTAAATDATYQYGFNFSKSNISYVAYPGDAAPVLNFSALVPASLRVCGIEVTGSGNTFQGLNVTGVQAGTLKQADNWRVAGSGNTFNQIVTHDDQGNGFYILSHGGNNLIKNCDSYNLVGVNGISAGNTDGFGCHSAGSGNVFQGDRAWGDSDDGYDCIDNPGGGVTFNGCWSYNNGRFDGNANGFKVGGFGNMGGAFPNPPSANIVEFCLSADNGANGFYANHQPGQAAFWYNNTSFNNKGADFNMLEAIDTTPANSAVSGTREVLHNNLAFEGTPVSNLMESGAIDAANSFTLPVTVNAADFLSTDASQMTLPRNADGSLPNITFMHLATGSDLINAGESVEFTFNGSAPDLGAFEAVPEPGTVGGMLMGVGILAMRRRRGAARVG